MNIQVDLTNTNHNFTKKNLVSQKDGSDIYKCRECGIEGIRPGFVNFVILKSSDEFCKVKRTTPKNPASKIKITTCNASGLQFGNLLPNSIHKIIEPPEEHAEKSQNWLRGVWVMGIGDPVMVLNNEFDIVEDINDIIDTEGKTPEDIFL